VSDVVIIDSGGANLASLQYALQRLGASSSVSSDAGAIAVAPRVLLPGVGAAGAAMQRLRNAGLVDRIRALRQPLLGVCLGMQLLYAHSEEGSTDCLGMIEGTVARIRSAPSLPVPQMGWNCCRTMRDDALLAGIGARDYVYFVHSYAAPVGDSTVAVVDYGAPLSAVVRRDNFWGVQFHPERSARVGARLLKNFLEL
jgi:imidazole glycerol-phosphate synthase subunit HisH